MLPAQPLRPTDLRTQALSRPHSLAPSAPVGVDSFVPCLRSVALKFVSCEDRSTTSAIPVPVSRDPAPRDGARVLCSSA